jgi:hypothetical protein
LRESRDRTAEGGSHDSRSIGVNFYRDEGAFVVVDGKTRGSREVIQNLFEIGNVLRDSANDYEGIVSILENRAREVVHQGVQKQPLMGGTEDQLLENISKNVEEKRREGISLAQPTAALDPSTRTPFRRTAV